MKLMLPQIQEDSAAVVDTLSQSYSNKWDAMSNLDQAGPLVQMFASHDLIFVVLGVSLIIWFILLYFIMRVDGKVGKLEQQVMENQQEKQSDEA